MSSGLLSLKWNNHKSTFFHVLSTIRTKESYCDVTLSCEGKFYPLHKFVLSTCSEYFEEMFEKTPCKHPVVVLNNINAEDLEALLSYMYVGEVNVVQEKLASLIKAAECLRIKGLAVPDEEPLDERPPRDPPKRHHNNRHEESPRAKRRKRSYDTSIDDNVRSKSNNKNLVNQSNSRISNNEIIRNNIENERNIPYDDVAEHNNDTEYNISGKKELPIEEVQQPEDNVVKPEPIDLDSDEEVSQTDNKTDLHNELGFDDMQNDESYADNDVDASLLGNMDDSQNLPGASGYQGNNIPMWEGDGSLSAFTEGLNADNSQNQQLFYHDFNVPLQKHQVLKKPKKQPTVAPHNWKPCKYCGRNFPDRFKLANHERTHTGEKPFECDLCPYRANQRANLERHKMRHFKQMTMGVNLDNFHESFEPRS